MNNHDMGPLPERSLTEPDSVNALPWRISNCLPGDVWDASNRLVANCNHHYGVTAAEATARAELIVTAVNTHAALLAACEGVLSVYDCLTDHGEEPYRPIVLGQKTVQALREAVAKARGGKP